MKFKIGDEVTCDNYSRDSKAVIGLSGTIIEVLEKQNQPYLVEFSCPPEHPSSWKGKKFLWWVTEDAIKLTKALSPEEIEQQRMEKIYAKIKHLYSKEKDKRTKQCQSSYVMKAAQYVAAGTTLASGRTGLSALAVVAAAEGNLTTSYTRAWDSRIWQDNNPFPF